MAEFVMKDMVKKAKLEWKYEIASAATSTEEIGNPVHRGTRAKLQQVGISCAGKTARQMTRRDYAEYDIIIGMDHYNMRNMQRICGGDPDGKLRMLLSRDVADPWYTGNFEDTYADVLQGCTALLQELEG
jgi:protein-tyrosine phosphatase